jgi:hypothetical protein
MLFSRISSFSVVVASSLHTFARSSHTLSVGARGHLTLAVVVIAAAFAINFSKKFQLK